MKTVLYLSLAAVLLLEACQQQPTIGSIEALPVDSLDIQGFESGQQIQNLEVIDSSMLCSFDPIGARLGFFKRQGPHLYEVLRQDTIDTETWGSHIMGTSGRHYFLSRSKELCIYDQVPSSHKPKRLTIHHRFGHLKDSFMLLSMHDEPILLRHDTLIAHYAHAFLQNYPAYLKEPHALAEWKLTGDTAVFLRSYIPKPALLAKQCLPFAKHCMLRNTIYLIYPGLDTIYTFDRSSGKSERIAIRNKDYVLPAAWDFKKLWTSDYNSYQTKYNLSTFAYEAIYYNSLSRHFILFYYAPVKARADGKLPTGEDQQLNALILDEDLKQLSYARFNKPFTQPRNYFFIPGKGLALPLLDETDNYETIRFYIYNL